MSYCGVPISLLLDIAKRDGVMFQLDLPLPHHLKIEEKFLTDCEVSFRCGTDTGWSGSTSTVDHPSFAKLRDWLEYNGNIETKRNQRNGDNVLKPFYLNNIYYDKDDRFYSAVATKSVYK